MLSNHFDATRQRVKKSHPTAGDFDSEIIAAITRSNSIASRYRLDRKSLTTQPFIDEYKAKPAELDFVKFFTDELDIKRPTLAENTVKSHLTVINHLRLFRPRGIPFNQISHELLQKFRNQLIKEENGNATIEKVLKNFKQY